MDSPRDGLWKSGIHTLLTSIVSVVAGLATSVLVARALGPEGKGAFDLAIATAALVALALGFSLPVGITYAVARGAAAPGALIRYAATWSVITGILALALFAAAKGLPIGAILLPASEGPALVLALALFVAFIGVSGQLRAVLLGQQRVADANLGDLIARLAVPSAMLLVLGAAAVAGTSIAPIHFVSSAASGAVVATAYYGWRLRRELRTRTGDLSLRDVMRVSLPSHLANLIQFMNYRLDLFLLSAFVGVSSVGIYALAVSLGQLLWLISNAAATVLLPRIALESKTGTLNADRVSQIARVAFWATGAAAAALGAGASVIVPALFGTAFDAATAVLLWLLPGILALSVVNVLASFVAGIGRPRVNLAVSAIGLVVTVALDLTLIPLLGAVGAAIASTFSYLASTIWMMFAFTRMTGVPARDLVVLRPGDVRLVRRLCHRS